MERGTTNNLLQQKQTILSFLRSRGPSLPVHISQNLKIDTLLASAIMADLLRDKEIKLSNLKVGNSPLYYLSGQEIQLEKFYNYLPSKEREAFEKLKSSKILNDKSQEPAIRVALRSIKDFAFPFKNDGEIYWRFLDVSEQDVVDLLSNVKKESPKTVAKTEIVEEKIKETIKQEVKQEKTFENPFIEKKKKKTAKKSVFQEAIEVYLKELDVKQDFGYKRKEYGAVVTLDKGDYLLIGKDKKSISYADVTNSMEKGKKLGLPVFLVGNGTPNKKASEWIEYFGDLFVFEQLE